MCWAVEDADGAIDKWLERDTPSQEIKEKAYVRLLDLTQSPVQPWAGDTESDTPGVGTGLFLADLVDDPLVIATYTIDRSKRIIYLGGVHTTN